MKKIDYANLNFERFRELAKDNSISNHVKVGFPDEYREGKEELIFSDIKTKLKLLNKTKQTVLEIGPGCSGLPLLLSDLCNKNSSKLLFVDSSEMLDLLPNDEWIDKYPGYYPNISGFFDKYNQSVNVILAYSVIQYIFLEGNLWDFLDRSLSLLAPGGEMLLGDIPNITMRKRFFSSDAGIKCHHEFTGKKEQPEIFFNNIEIGQIDDSVIYSLISRARSQGFHAWVIPQARDLPMANRREDILIVRP